LNLKGRKKYLIILYPLKRGEKKDNFLVFFKDCKKAEDIPANVFIQLDSLFKLTVTCSRDAFFAQALTKTWTFPCIFYLISENKLFETVGIITIKS
jgi:hypothetical protein